jgi:single-stranded DNA-binding protein
VYQAGLKPGDKVVLTGDISTDNEELKARAERVGLRVPGSVCGKTVLLVGGRTLIAVRQGSGCEAVGRSHRNRAGVPLLP